MYFITTVMKSMEGVLHHSRCGMAIPAWPGLDGQDP